MADFNLLIVAQTSDIGCLILGVLNCQNWRFSQSKPQLRLCFPNFPKVLQTFFVVFVRTVYSGYTRYLDKPDRFVMGVFGAISSYLNFWCNCRANVRF
jgi:hypothetical protein